MTAGSLFRLKKFEVGIFAFEVIGQSQLILTNRSVSQFLNEPLHSVVVSKHEDVFFNGRRSELVEVREIWTARDAYAVNLSRCEGLSQFLYDV